MSYEINREIEVLVGAIVKEGCHVLKTGTHIGIFVFCDQDTLEEKRNDINKAIEDYRNRYSLYVMTEKQSRESRV